VPNFPRRRALALFGRRLPRPVEAPSSRRPKTCTAAEVAVISSVESKVQPDAEDVVGEMRVPVGLSPVRSLVRQFDAD